MPDRPPLDPLIKNVRVVRPRHDALETRDLGIADGRGQLGFPRVVDAHTHVGIYAPFATTRAPRARPRSPAA